MSDSEKIVDVKAAWTTGAATLSPSLKMKKTMTAIAIVARKQKKAFDALAWNYFGQMKVEFFIL